MSNSVKGKQPNDKFFTIEFFGVTVILSSFLLLVCLFFGKSVLFEIGFEVQSFILGLFGYFSYPLLICTTAIGVMMLLGKKPSAKYSTKNVVILAIYLVIILSLLTVLTSIKTPADFSEYISHAYNSGRGGLQTVVAGGVLFSLIAYLPVKYLTYIGAIVAFLILAVIVGVYAYKTRIIKPAQTEKASENPVQQAQPSPQQYAQPTQPVYNQQPIYNQQVQPTYVQPTEPNPYSGYQNQPYVNPLQQGAVYSDRDLHDKNMQILYGNQNGYPSSYQASYNLQPPVSSGVNEVKPQDPPVIDNSPSISKTSVPFDVEDSFSTTAPTSSDFDEFDEFDEFDSEETVEDLKDNDISDVNDIEDIEDVEEIEEVNNTSNTAIKSPVSSFFNENNAPKTPSVEPETVSDNIQEGGEEYTKHLIENMPKNYKYVKPPMSIFKTVDNSANNYDHEVFKGETVAKILATLKTFGVDTKIAAVYRGPAVTRFDIEIPPDVPMNKVTKLYGDLNLRIAARSAVRMIAPVPNTSYVGIEVPNSVPDSVAIKDILVSDDFMVNKPFSLIFALGKDVIGRPVSLDLADMPHMLVTGTTGSGKSVCLNSLVISLITKYGPDELRFVIVDPKRVDLEPFKELPHMMFGEIIEDVPTTNAMLGWAVQEMERRYVMLASSRVKNIKDYNIKARQNGDKIMPRIVIMMDEFADIMLQDKKGVAVKVCLIAQKARAAGIHLVLAAQRPSVDVVEGPIKSNLPSRVVFRASSLADSMVSLGEAGAEKLLGRGDCLYKTGGMLNVERVMGAYVSDEEMFAVIDYVSEHNEKYYDHNNWAKIKASVTPSQPSQSDSSSDGQEDDMEGYVDPLCIKAMRLGFDNGGLSVSMLQRKLAVGYPRAGKIIDWLESNGYITPNAVGGKRQMIITREDFEEKFGEN
ncbi:MAG: hypothetical protein IKL82_05525 [Clostridia bacterium]|nr:hypothetical protein [Clostridia bacterium]